MKESQMNTFFITGLPRSRTAWIANLFTYGPAYCFHEAPMFCEWDINKIPEMFKHVNKPYVGNSDSSIPHFMDFHEKIFPDARYVLVTHDVKIAAKETDEIFGFDTKASLLQCQAALIEYAKRFNPFVIAFNDLNKIESVRALWNYCIPTEPFDELRYRMLNDFNIQLTESGLSKRRALLCQHG